MKKVISTKKAPQAIGPYSQAIEANKVMYLSGQIPLIPETGEMENGDIVAQTTQVMKNIGAVLEANDLTYKNVVKTTVFVTDLNDFEAVNKVYSEYFTKKEPARSCVQVAALPKGAKVEIESIAICK